MARNQHFHFKQFSVYQKDCAMKVSTDACLFGAIVDIAYSTQILDIGTGTGLLALMAAQRSQATIDAVELDPSAAEQATKNVSESPWKDRISVITQSIQNFTTTALKRYDGILCNPPFFTGHMASACALRHQARHNDALAFEELARCAKTLLTEEGEFHVLLPTSELERFIIANKQAGLFLTKNISVRPTLRKEVSRQIMTFRHQPALLTEHEICIHGKDGYTEAFTERLKPFYLKL
ncbi:tRNA1(Val) (adenine(37)-N6)-methyltransferase [Sansalvadorimonas verongulae]|uniref:tRNA1(Val) (adenine(37)-N6)-methyltransferase n=1 Tax=Sansalvadorimonas verongulae TaxID=2172824 RepID=UPI0012BBA130|nr:methyltransferase [Sansalvadorimonas verongulae]MTI13445.1 methyltransferase domain-containing protein [Sansalvadorimonas verongulae]